MHRPASAGLWRNPDFMKLWIGQTISEFGSRITRDAIILIAVTILAATPEELGLLSALSSLPVMLFGLFAGIPVDRYRRRPLMIATDLTRMILLLSIPVATLTGTLTIGLLIVVAAAMGILGMVFDAAYRAILPALIAPEHLMDGNTKLATTDALAEIGGPAISGLLIQTITAPLAIVFDAISYLFSAVSFIMIRVDEKSPKRESDEEQSFFQEALEGIRFIARDPILRTIALSLGLRNFFGNFYGVLYSFYAIRELGLTPATLGILIGCGGIGALVGAAVSPRVVRAVGAGHAMTGAALVAALAGFLTILAGGSWLTIMLMMGASQIIGDGAMTVFQINELTLRQKRVSDHLLGRVTAGLAFVGEVVSPAGALAGGFLGGLLGARLTLAIAVLGILLVAVWLATSPLRKMK